MPPLVRDGTKVVPALLVDKLGQRREVVNVTVEIAHNESGSLALCIELGLDDVEHVSGSLPCVLVVMRPIPTLHVDDANLFAFPKYNFVKH